MPVHPVTLCGLRFEHIKCWARGWRSVGQKSCSIRTDCTIKEPIPSRKMWSGFGRLKIRIVGVFYIVKNNVPTKRVRNKESTVSKHPDWPAHTV